jgi:tetratricopeptide (TPR) repeat protein
MFIDLGRLRYFLVCIFLLAWSGGVPTVFAGEVQWVEVHSPNFSVVTDAGEKRGREAAMRFEQMRAAFGSLIGKDKVGLPIPLQIVAFRNAKELRQVSPLFNGKPTEVDGLFLGGSDRGYIMLDMSAESPWTVVFHEYGHQLLNGNFPGGFQPWFDEGFAEYFSSIEVDNKETRVGKVPPMEYRILREMGTMKVADLFSVQHDTTTYNESGDHRTTFYAESGMMLHYLFDNNLMPKVAAYFDLTENQHVPVENAIQRGFGMSPAQLDHALRVYIYDGRYHYYPLHNLENTSSNSYSVAPVTVSEVNALIAEIHLHTRDYHEQAIKEFEDVLKVDPNNATALRGLGYASLQKADYAKAGDYFKRAVDANTRDPRVHYYYAQLLVRQGRLNGDDRSVIIKELETSISLDPKFADSYALLAMAESSSGQRDKALVDLQKALAISPRNESYLCNLGSLYLSSGQPDEAIATVQAIAVSSNPATASQARMILSEARRYKEGMRVVPTPAPSGASATEEISSANTASAVTIVPTRPAKFLKGELVSVDCSVPPAAVLTITSSSSTRKLKVANRDRILLIGADQFSCEWKHQKAAVNYREDDAGEGAVISLEIQ